MAQDFIVFFVGLQIDIIREGESLVGAGGSLMLVEARNESLPVGSGSGEDPTSLQPTQEPPATTQSPAGRLRREMSSPRLTALPPLPASVDAVVFSWAAGTRVSSELLCLCGGYSICLFVSTSAPGSGVGPSPEIVFPYRTSFQYTC